MWQNGWQIVGAQAVGTSFVVTIIVSSEKADCRKNPIANDTGIPPPPKEGGWEEGGPLGATTISPSSIQAYYLGEHREVGEPVWEACPEGEGA